MSTPIQETNCYDPRFNLPTCPNHNNPHVYMAYIHQLDMDSVDVPTYEVFFNYCMQGGIFYRWPDRKEGEASWDEVMGAASISPMAAQVLLDNFRFKWNRFIFLKAYLRIRSGKSATWWDRLLIETWIKFTTSGNLEPGDAGGRLKSWVIISDTGILQNYWLQRVMGAGFTLKGSLQIEPGDNPWLAENASDRWFI